MCQDTEYLNRFKTRSQINSEINRCQGFIVFFLEASYRLSDKEAAIKRWEHRVSLLKAKLLLLGE